MKRLNPVIFILLAFVALCLALTLPDALSDKKEERTNLFYHYYSIEPSSLVEALNTGDINVFSPIDEEPPSIPLDQQISVAWTQEDYFRIANALFQFIWGNTDTLEGWQINSMDFDLGCEAISDGFQNGNFRFFKIKKTDERESRIERIVNIDPGSKFVFITENEYSPRLVDWSAIDLGQSLPSAEDILQIAEKAGGQEKRFSVKNACSISLWIYPSAARYNGWEVYYYRRDDGTTLFHVEIDPITGKIR